MLAILFLWMVLPAGLEATEQRQRPTVPREWTLERRSTPAKLEAAQSTVRRELVQRLLHLPGVFRGQDILLPFTYAPYRAGQGPGDSVAESNISEDMQIIGGQAKLLRTYGACEELEPIASLAGLKALSVFQGAWLSDDLVANSAELDCLADLVSQQSNIVAAVAGNEALLRGELSEMALTGYVAEVHQFAPSLPVSTGETWATWCNLQPGAGCAGLPVLSSSVDFVLAHVLPYWESVPVEHAAAHVVAAYLLLAATYPELPVILGETGWPSCGAVRREAVPSLDNQRTFIKSVRRLSLLHGAPMLVTEAFDQGWKTSQEGNVGACWGLFGEDRSPKHGNLISPVPISSQPIVYGPSIRISHPAASPSIVTKPNCTVPIFGKAYAPEPGWKVTVEVFTDQWYLQDKWHQAGEVPIVGESWGIPEIFLAGQGSFNNHRIRATLLDESGDPVTSAQIDGIVRTNDCSP